MLYLMHSDCRPALSALAAACKSKTQSLYLVTLEGDSFGTPPPSNAIGLGVCFLLSNRQMEEQESFTSLRHNLGSHLASSSV